MKKNLKKLISAVIAMAVAGSLIPASFAAKVTLTDVAETAPYATAVNTLVALEVINGYEDDTFLPDNKITRAEVTKVVVAALNQTESAEGQTGATGFADVAADFWANGYINAGVQMGFINGMENNTFAPQANVTFAQIAKMLVSSLGYEDYAQFLGGWPNGYLAIANQEGITNGVKASANDAVTRAQVAQMVYNALNTPIVENAGLKWSDAGKLVPSIEKQDGKKDDVFYKSVLTENFDAYLVEGYVVETAKEGTLEKDEVKFAIAKSQKYDSALGTGTIGANVSSLSAANAEGRVVIANVGDTDAADFKGAYAVAIVLVDEFEDNIILSFMPSGKNKSVKVDVDLIDTDSALTNNNLWIYASENADKSTKYPLALNEAETAIDVDVYVNGYQVLPDTEADPVETIEDVIAEYVLGANAGTIELVDTYKTDGYYDTIYVESYVTAVVDDVVTSSDYITFDGTNFFTVGNIATAGSLSLDTEADEDLEYKIIYNGQEISLAELKSGDVLSIACDITASSLADCDDLTIYVSRDVQSGKFSAANPTDELITIGGTAYSFLGDYSTLVGNFVLGDEYTISLDIFGRIVTSELNASTAKYAIVDLFKADDGSGDGNKVRLYTADGAVKTLILDIDATYTIPGVDEADVDDFITRVGATAAARTPIENRVIKYKVNTSTGYIRDIEVLAADANIETITPDEGEPYEANVAVSYKASTGKLGNVRVAAATKVIDAIAYADDYADTVISADYNDLAVASIDSFNESVKYEVFGFDKIDRVHSFVIVVAGEADYTADARFAVVVTPTSTGMDEVGEDIYSFKAYTADSEEVVDLVASYKATGAAALKTGDVIIYKSATNGYIDDVKVLNTVDSVEAYATLVEDVVNGYTVTLPVSGISTDWINTWIDGREDKTNDAIQLLYGVVVKSASNKQIALAAGNVAEKTMLEVDATKAGDNAAKGIYEIDVNDETAVYTYNFAKKGTNRVAKGIVASVIPTVLGSDCYEDEDKTIIDWNETNARNDVRLAFVKVVDGVATDIFYISNK